MTAPLPETIRTASARVACDGTGPGLPPAPGPPPAVLQIDEHGYVACGYCDRRFVLIGGPADGADQSRLPDHPAGASI